MDLSALRGWAPARVRKLEDYAVLSGRRQRDGGRERKAEVGERLKGERMKK